MRITAQPQPHLPRTSVSLCLSLRRRQPAWATMAALRVAGLCAAAGVVASFGGGGPGGRHHNHWGRPDDPNTESRWECHDGVDDDNDGMKDCDDTDCAGHPCCTGQCHNPQFGHGGHNHRPRFCDDPNCKPSTQPCPYTTTAQLAAAIKNAGCEIGNQNNDCSQRCAETFLPLDRACTALMATLPSNPVKTFRLTCIREIHLHSHDKWHPTDEWGPACHDGKDNDGDGIADCDDTNCAHHPCCQGPSGPAAQCNDPQFAAARPWCSDPNCVATQKPLPLSNSCDSTVVLPVVLQCWDWTQIALADDSKITADDGFCDSSCYEFLAPVYALCKGRMAKTMEAALSALTPSLGKCTAAVSSKPLECNPVRLETACKVTAREACSAQCTRAIDAMRGPCKGNPNFASYEKMLKDCAESVAQRQCLGSSFAAKGNYIQYINEVCCEHTPCTSTPTDCTPECADVFLPYFSRCGSCT